VSSEAPVCSFRRRGRPGGDAARNAADTPSDDPLPPLQFDDEARKLDPDVGDSGQEEALAINRD